MLVAILITKLIYIYIVIILFFAYLNPPIKKLYLYSTIFLILTQRKVIFFPFTKIIVKIIVNGSFIQKMIFFLSLSFFDSNKKRRRGSVQYFTFFYLH